MIQPEIMLVCAAHEKGMDEVRLNLLHAMKAAGYLPHWKESYDQNKMASRLMIRLNGKNAWEGEIKEFVLLSHEKLGIILQQHAKNGFRWKRFLKVQASFFSALVVAFFPKCPFCWAAYMSLFSSLGLGKISYQPWLLPVFIILLFLNITSLYLSRKRHGYKPMLLALNGALLITLNRFYWHRQEIMIIGAILLITASLWNSLPKRMLISLKYYFFQWAGKTNKEMEA